MRCRSLIGLLHMVWQRMVAPHIESFNYFLDTGLQEAVADILTIADQPFQGHASYYDFVRAMYKAKRDTLVDALTVSGMQPYVPEGGIFVMANTSAIDFPTTFADEPGPDGTAPVSRDWAFCRYENFASLSLVRLFG